MEAVNILDARNNLSRLVAAAARGEEVVIANRGTPVVRLVPVDVAPEPDHSLAAAAIWFLKNPPPEGRKRTIADLDQQIRENREAWD
jgi:prevent-host-death family protein